MPKKNGSKRGVLRIYKSYMFRDKDPVIDAIRTVRQDTGTTYAEIQEKGGANAQTVRNWEHGKVRRPQFATVWATLRAMGKRSIRSGESGYPKID